MAAGEWSGFEDGDMEMDFAGAKFNLHRAIVAQASPVWKAMLTGTFAESTENVVHFDGDDPQVARLCVEMIYSTFADSTLDWADIESRVMLDRAAFDAFVDKYDLIGVKRLVKYELHTRKETRQLINFYESECFEEEERLEGNVERLGEEVKKLEGEVKQLATTPGKPVDIREYEPEMGTWVKRRVPSDVAANGMDKNQWYKYNTLGKVIAIDGNSVNVRWKNGGAVRCFNPMWDHLEYA